MKRRKFVKSSFWIGMGVLIMPSVAFKEKQKIPIVEEIKGPKLSNLYYKKMLEHKRDIEKVCLDYKL